MINTFKINNSIEISSSLIEPDSWGCLAEGYFWSLKILINHILESDLYQNKWVIYPILYNIRHYYELSLKDILANLGYISKEKLLIETHKLDKLINLLEKFSKKYFDENKERIGALLLIKDIDACISIIKKEMSDFINFDNYSLTFRYPYYKNGIHTIKEPITFNAKKMYDSVLVCRNQLTKISTQLICDDNNPRFEKRV